MFRSKPSYSAKRAVMALLVCGLYVDGLAGFGGHRQFDWGVGIGVRFSY